MAMAGTWSGREVVEDDAREQEEVEIDQEVLEGARGAQRWRHGLAYWRSARLQLAEQAEADILGRGLEECLYSVPRSIEHEHAPLVFVAASAA